MKIDFLKQMCFLYHTMRATENLLYSAASLCPLGRDDLGTYYLDHLKEESGHADWLARDLRVAGIDVKNTPIPVEATEIVGHVYYMIFHADPCALLGYMQLMEGNPMSIDRIEALEMHHGKDVLRTMRYHAEHDPEHIKSVNAEVLKLSVDRQNLVKQTHDVCLGYFLKAASHFTDIKS